MTDKALRAAHRVVKKTGSRDPARIAQELDIELLVRSDFVQQKGAFCLVLGQSFILISDKLSEDETRLVLAHELGHALLHKEIAQKGVLCEYDLFNMSTSIEYEANVFAAELLIDTQEMKELLSTGCDVYRAAKALGVNVNLLLIKLAELNRRGGHYRLPYVPYKDFIGS